MTTSADWAAMQAIVADELKDLWPNPPEPELARLIGRPLPDAGAPDGAPQFADEDAARIDALFERFGVPLRVRGTPRRTIAEAYDFCALYLGQHVFYRMCDPDFYDYLVKDWPGPWKSYVEAIVAGDLAAAQGLFRELDPLAPGCPYPPGLHAVHAGIGNRDSEA